MLPLKTTLLVNGISSGATGVLLVLFAKPAAQLFGVTATAPFTGTGIFLCLFAALVLITARKHPLNRNAVKLITLLDTLWVLTSIAVVMLLASMLSVIGVIAIIAVAAWVGGMALLQSRGLKQGSGGNMKELMV